MGKALFVRPDLAEKNNSKHAIYSYYKKTLTSPDVYPSFFLTQYLIFIISEEKPRSSLMHIDTPQDPGLERHVQLEMTKIIYIYEI